ncbi:hypothetical protein, partial [Pseudomonas proteolytica]|uniref:hypothetical protein n=1 Tax=Pseudomonas proteolytica TaxID=219574 RepID=UPI0030D8925D
AGAGCRQAAAAGVVSGPLGDPRAASPFDVTCAVSGQGRWVDPQTFVYDFANGLPGGTVCKFKLRSGLKSVSGYAVTGQQEFSVDAGGPVARAVLPSQYDSEIEEDQVFLVAANLPATPASVAANAYCAVKGIGEKIPVEVLAPDLPGKLLGEMGRPSPRPPRTAARMARRRAAPSGH